MDEARCVEQDKVITGEELYLLDDVDKLSFICDECHVRLIPCSYKKEINLKRPYFKTYKGENHENCGNEGNSELKKKGLKDRLTTDQGFPLPYPSRFLISKRDKNHQNSGFRSKTPSLGKSRAKNDFDDFDDGRVHNNTTSSFKAVVNQYFDFPQDRDLPLQFEGVEGSTYSDIFRKILSPVGKQEFRLQGETKKIYFAPLSWSAHEEENDKIKVFLTRGLWRNSKNERPYYVEVDFKGQPQQSKTKFVNLLNKTRDLIKGTKNTALIAFVGHQDTTDDYFRFYSDDRYLIAFKLFHDDV